MCLIKDIIEKDNYYQTHKKVFDTINCLHLCSYVVQSYFIIELSIFVKSLKLSAEDLSSFSNYGQFRFNVSA